VDGRTYGCRKLDVIGIPCSHVILAIRHQGGDLFEYLSEYYSKEKYLKVYDNIVYPVPSKDQWLRSNQPKIESPKSRSTPGRPKKLRRRDVDELRNPNAIRRGTI
jgi:hypothetical protein